MQSILSRPRLPQYVIKWKGDRERCSDSGAPFACARGKTKNEAVPSWSRPLANGAQAIDGQRRSSGTAFQARPMKHWRKQLAPRTGTGPSSSGIGMPMDRPGGSVPTTNSECCNTADSFVIAKYVSKPSQTPCRPSDVLNVSPSCNPENPVFAKKQACNPVANRIRSGTTLVNRGYYTDSQAYLRSRCRTYDQRLSGTQVPGVSYFTADGSPRWPSSTESPGPQSRAMNTRYQACESECYGGPGKDIVAVTIYKPSNSQFAVQGAVSSGARIDRLRYNTVQLSAARQKTAWGSQTASASAYNGSSNAPFTVKSKYAGNTKCVSARRRRGNHALCFNTPCNSSSGGAFCARIGGQLAVG